MKKCFVVFVLGIATLAAQTTSAEKSKKSDKKKTTAAAAKTVKPAPAVGKPLTIPTDAVQNPDGTYSYTDKAGKKWIFTKTPFGISRTEDMSAAMKLTTPSAALYLTAFDNGDTVKFERKTPFGVSKWEKKKTELNDEEREALARATAQPEQKPE